MKELGNRIAEEIRKAGITKIAFANSIGTNPTTLNNYLKGIRVIPSDKLADIACCLHISADLLLFGQEAEKLADTSYYLSQAQQKVREIRKQIEDLDIEYASLAKEIAEKLKSTKKA